MNEAYKELTATAERGHGPNCDDMVVAVITDLDPIAYPGAIRVACYPKRLSNAEIIEEIKTELEAEDGEEWDRIINNLTLHDYQRPPAEDFWPRQALSLALEVSLIEPADGEDLPQVMVRAFPTKGEAEVLVGAFPLIGADPTFWKDEIAQIVGDEVRQALMNAFCMFVPVTDSKFPNRQLLQTHAKMPPGAIDALIAMVAERRENARFQVNDRVAIDCQTEERTYKGNGIVAGHYQPPSAPELFSVRHTDGVGGEFWYEARDLTLIEGPSLG